MFSRCKIAGDKISTNAVRAIIQYGNSGGRCTESSLVFKLVLLVGEKGHATRSQMLLNHVENLSTATSDPKIIDNTKETALLGQNELQSRKYQSARRVQMDFEL